MAALFIGSFWLFYFSIEQIVHPRHADTSICACIVAMGK